MLSYVASKIVLRNRCQEASGALFGAGLMGLWFLRTRRKNKRGDFCPSTVMKMLHVNAGVDNPRSAFLMNYIGRRLGLSFFLPSRGTRRNTLTGVK